MASPSTDPKSALDLTGKVAIITGSGKENGIGAGIALALARAGARVAVNYVSESTAARVPQVVAAIEAAAGEGSVVVVQADVSTPEGAEKLVEKTVEGFGVDHVDILVNNAAWGKGGPITACTPEELHKAFSTVVYGPIYLIKAAIPYMGRGGRIINIGTVASKLAIPMLPLYAASKAAMDTLTYSLAQELGRDGKGITVNTVAPGPILTDSMPPVPQVQALKEWLVARTRAEERVGTVEDVADAVLLLASEKSRWITGQYISVSGGITGN